MGWGVGEGKYDFGITTNYILKKFTKIAYKL